MGFTISGFRQPTLPKKTVTFSEGYLIEVGHRINATANNSNNNSRTWTQIEKPSENMMLLQTASIKRSG